MSWYIEMRNDPACAHCSMIFLKSSCYKTEKFKFEDEMHRWDHRYMKARSKLGVPAINL